MFTRDVFSVPSQPYNFLVTKLTTNIIRLSWEEPPSHRNNMDRVTSYLLVYSCDEPGLCRVSDKVFAGDILLDLLS